MKTILPVAVVLVVAAVATYFQGKYSERWGKVRSEQLSQFTSRLAGVPKVIGDWEGTDEKIDEKQFARSNCDGQVSRKYQNRRTGDVVSVYLVSGTGRHVTIHTPDWCYQGAGYDMDGQPIAYTIPVEGVQQSPEFRTTTFTKHEASGMTDRLRIFWSFTDDGNWHGPSSPKPMFGTRDALFKVYFITKAALRQERPEDSPTLVFAREFFPEVNKALFPASQSAPAVASR